MTKKLELERRNCILKEKRREEELQESRKKRCASPETQTGRFAKHGKVQSSLQGQPYALVEGGRNVIAQTQIIQGSSCQAKSAH